MKANTPTPTEDVADLKKQLEDTRLLVTQAEIVILQKDLEIGKLKSEILRLQSIELNQQLQQRNEMLQRLQPKTPDASSQVQDAGFVPAGQDQVIPLTTTPPRASVTRRRR